MVLESLNRLVSFSRNHNETNYETGKESRNDYSIVL
jgi:hypothetical protein